MHQSLAEQLTGCCRRSDEEGECSGSGLAELQRTMARVVATQKEAARKKQIAVLQARCTHILHTVIYVGHNVCLQGAESARTSFYAQHLDQVARFRNSRTFCLQRAQAQIDADANQLMKSTEHDMACLQALGQAELQKLAQQMAAKMTSIRKLQEECQQVSSQ